MATSDERREVAERMRVVAYGPYVDTLSFGEMMNSVLTDGAPRPTNYREMFRCLADLIDPTCEAAYDNPFASDFNYRCMACGEHFSTCGEPRYCPGCGRRIEHVK